jgi:hypothetical protein
VRSAGRQSTGCRYRPGAGAVRRTKAPQTAGRAGAAMCAHATKWQEVSPVTGLCFICGSANTCVFFLDMKYCVFFSAFLSTSSCRLKRASCWTGAPRWGGRLRCWLAAPLPPPQVNLDLLCGADRHPSSLIIPLSLYLGPRLVNVVSLRKRPNSLYLKTNYLRILVLFNLVSSTSFSASAGPLPAPATPAPAAHSAAASPVVPPCAPLLLPLFKYCVFKKNSSF